MKFRQLCCYAIAAAAFPYVLFIWTLIDEYYLPSQPLRVIFQASVKYFFDLEEVSLDDVADWTIKQKSSERFPPPVLCGALFFVGGTAPGGNSLAIEAPGRSS